MFIYNPQNFPAYKLQYLFKTGEMVLYITKTNVTSNLSTTGMESTKYTIQDLLDSHLTFTDRESYLSWVKSWKEQYRALTAKIRIYKKLNKTKYFESLTPEQRDQLNNIEPRSPWPDLHYKAKVMLACRAEAKVRSWEMRNKRLAEV